MSHTAFSHPEADERQSEQPEISSLQTSREQKMAHAYTRAIAEISAHNFQRCCLEGYYFCFDCAMAQYLDGGNVCPACSRSMAEIPPVL